MTSRFGKASEVPDPDVDARVRAVLGQVIDPEMALDIVSLGLVVGVQASERRVEVELTMTSAACPVAELIVEEAETALTAAFGDGFDVSFTLVWSPAWSPGRMSAGARAAMGWS